MKKSKTSAPNDYLQASQAGKLTQLGWNPASQCVTIKESKNDNKPDCDDVTK
jgi:hypothetical protein